MSFPAGHTAIHPNAGEAAVKPENTYSHSCPALAESGELARRVVPFRTLSLGGMEAALYAQNTAGKQAKGLEHKPTTSTNPSQPHARSATVHGELYPLVWDDERRIRQENYKKLTRGKLAADGTD